MEGVLVRVSCTCRAVKHELQALDEAGFNPLWLTLPSSVMMTVKVWTHAAISRNVPVHESKEVLSLRRGNNEND